MRPSSRNWSSTTFSGQLKVAPEHCAPATLAAMGKPRIEVFNRFVKRFYELTREAGKKQYLVPYLMSSHPGSTLKDAVILAEYLADHHMKPEQVQDFYPTPGTVSTCMFYTGLDPYTLKPVYVAKSPEEKSLQRALLQYYEPRNRAKVRRALALTGRLDLLPKLLPYDPAARRAQGGQKGPSPASAQHGAGGRETKNKRAPAGGRGGKASSSAGRKTGKDEARWRADGAAGKRKRR